MAHAAEFAETGSWEPVEQLTTDVYTRAHPGQEVTSGVAAG
jgi:hypothetical protein